MLTLEMSIHKGWSLAVPPGSPSWGDRQEEKGRVSKDANY